MFRVKHSKNELLRFYVENFGMTNKETFSSSTVIGYSTNYDEDFHPTSNELSPPTYLEFHHKNSSTNEKLLVNSGISNVYWKIGITTYDVDHVRKILQSKQIQCDDPVQFEDIGYVCHLKDPNGFIIELLQHDFQKTFNENIKKNGRKIINNHFSLGYPCCLGQITLQTNDIMKTRWFYEDILAMKLLSIQKITKFDFTLYFFGWIDENPPKSDLEDIFTNREWLWKRPYTIIEFRYFHNQKRTIPPFKDLQENEIGFEGIRIMCNDLNLFTNKLNVENIHFEQLNRVYENEIVIRDPNNIPIYVSLNKHSR